MKPDARNVNSWLIVGLYSRYLCGLSRRLILLPSCTQQHRSHHNQPFLTSNLRRFTPRRQSTLYSLHLPPLSEQRYRGTRRHAVCVSVELLLSCMHVALVSAVKVMCCIQCSLAPTIYLFSFIVSTHGGSASAIAFSYSTKNPFPQCHRFPLKPCWSPANSCVKDMA